MIADVNARETVGDAYFLRKNFITSLGIEELAVVTSDYHADRTDVIFKKSLPPRVRLKTFGVETKARDELDMKKHEVNSLAAFLETFSGVDFSNERDVFQSLSSGHPFYNS